MQITLVVTLNIWYNDKRNGGLNMKILHTADWHLGKNLHGASLIDEQRHAMQQIIEIAKTEEVDAIIVAGDLYDKPIPTIEATELLEATLYTLNVELELPVLAISGNHDSATRLAFGNAWYEKNQLHVSGGLRQEIEVVTMGQIQFWLVPYHDVQTARYALGDTSIKNVDDAMGVIVERIKERADVTKKQVLIGHAFVAGGLMSDSERSLSVGNVERVSVPRFDFFDYVALGHLHNPHALQEEKIKYSGSPVKYSFSESEQEKIVRIIDIDRNVRVKSVAITPLQDVRVIKGALQELIDHPKEPVTDFIKAE